MGQTQTETAFFYIDLKREIKYIWNLKDVKIDPITLSCVGLIPKRLDENIQNVGIPQTSCKLPKKSVVSGVKAKYNSPSFGILEIFVFFFVYYG